ncbi:hypothetical protein [Photobacterium profundum]|uniref:Uncharacterized protein n=1 Tax=Photobacterium profundum (strain SS9) TaxID=298386 RepID=Q6LHC3_PHOPR|nr:hypothetical protein [Photobacterium profundum]CAG23307.1 hypothetical protein PBPRB1441 [Photobacterium profundum SS9]
MTTKTVDELLVMMIEAYNAEVIEHDSLINDLEATTIERDDLAESCLIGVETAKKSRKIIEEYGHSINHLKAKLSQANVKIAGLEHDNKKLSTESKELKRTKEQIKRLQVKNKELLTGNESLKKSNKKYRSDIEKASVVVAQSRISKFYSNEDGEQLMLFPHLLSVTIDGQDSKEKQLCLLYSNKKTGAVYRGIVLDEHDEVGVAIPEGVFALSKGERTRVVKHLPQPSDDVLELSRNFLIKLKSQNWAVMPEDLDMARLA